MNTQPQPQTLQAAILSLGLSITSEFVPFSKSRNANEKQPSLNWRVTLRQNDRAILTTDYMAGCAHCPSYKLKDPYYRRQAIALECEQGRKAKVLWENHAMATREPILPSTPDVIYSLVSDADVLNYGSYEEWASNFGYDPDSRKGETTYRMCLEIALKLRAALGDTGLTTLQAAAADY